MAKRGGFGPGMIPGSGNNLLKQAQRMQRQMEETSRELEEKEYSAQSGGNAVSVVMTGKRELKSVTISPEAVDPEDVETLEDLIVAAVNEVLTKIDEDSKAQMGKFTGGLGGLF